MFLSFCKHFLLFWASMGWRNLEPWLLEQLLHGGPDVVLVGPPVGEAWLFNDNLVEPPSTRLTRNKQPRARITASPLSRPMCSSTASALPQKPVQLVRDRWRLEGWHWIRHTQRHEDAHRSRGNGAGAMATLRTAALICWGWLDSGISPMA